MVYIKCQYVKLNIKSGNTAKPVNRASTVSASLKQNQANKRKYFILRLKFEAYVALPGIPSLF